MKKVKLFAMAIVIAAVVAVGVGLAIAAESEQGAQPTSTKIPEGRHLEIELKESVGVKETP